MQLDKLALDLRPRTNAQALDLGFSLLRAHAGAAYLSWLALLLPLVVFCGVLASLMPSYSGWFMLLLWWVRPLLERAPLYVLSRQVFGENVGWRDALRAWPKQLRGGWLPLLTWLRLFAAGRCLYQPVWQLEGARGKTAAERRRIIGRNGTARSAFWFGIACGHLEAVLQIGMLAFIGIFVSNESVMNPLAYVMAISKMPDSWHYTVLYFGGYAFGAGIIGPIFTACGFTLYLNRRATLEAWDLEIALRQIHPPLHQGVNKGIDKETAGITAGKRSAATVLGTLMGISILFSVLAQPSPMLAATVQKDQEKCTPSESVKEREATRQPDLTEGQAKLRRQLAQLYDTDDLRNDVCEETWLPKKSEADKKKVAPKTYTPPNFGELANILKVVLIATVLCLVGWVLYRYRDQLGSLMRPRKPRGATEIAGLDIRPESLPDDVPGRVAALWAQGERRVALALLYRATLSRLVNEDGLVLNQGATEGDCLRLANMAFRNSQLQAGRLQVTTNATDLWIHAAYADRWPDDAAVSTACAGWRNEFAIVSSASSASTVKATTTLSPAAVVSS